MDDTIKLYRAAGSLSQIDRFLRNLFMTNAITNVLILNTKGFQLKTKYEIEINISGTNLWISGTRAMTSPS